MTEQLYRWVKASEPPQKESYFKGRNIGEDRELNLHWDGENWFIIYKHFEIKIPKKDIKYYQYASDCPYTPPPSLNLEESAEAYLIQKYFISKPTIEEELKEFNELKNAYISGGLHERADESQMNRLYNWIIDENRKPATTFFTSGWLRNVAKEIEQRLAGASLFNKEELPEDMTDPWPTKDVLAKLIEAAEILLHQKSYDGHGYEQIEICVKRGKEILSKPGFNKESFLTALRDSNPYPEPDSNDKAWNECFKKVVELLNQSK